jgi:hypothetical protein
MYLLCATGSLSVSKLEIPTYAKCGRTCDISYSIRKKFGFSKLQILKRITNEPPLLIAALILQIFTSKNPCDIHC